MQQQASSVLPISDSSSESGGSMWAAIVAGVIGLVGTIANVVSRGHAQSQNQANFERQQAWTERTQERMFEREDTQLQRRRDDAVSAGFSPLSALGEGSSDTVVSQPSSPQHEGLDFSSLIGTVADLALETRRLNIQESLVPAQIANMNSQTALNNANAAFTSNQSVAESNARVQHMESEIEQLSERINLTAVETETARVNLNLLLDTYGDKIEREKAEIAALVAAAASDAADAVGKSIRNEVEEILGFPIEVIKDPQAYATYLGARAVAHVSGGSDVVFDSSTGGLSESAQEVTDVLASPYRVQSPDSDKKHWWDRFKEAIDNYFGDTVKSAMEQSSY